MGNREKTCQDKRALFESCVRRYFAFLEIEFEFKQLDTVVRNPKSRMDRELEIPFLSESVGLVVRWAPIEHDVSVDFVELKAGQIPPTYSLDGDIGYARAITLDSLIDVVAGRAIDPVLPQLTPRLSFSETCRRADAKRRMVCEEFENVVLEYARRTRQYASNVLEGQLNIFDKVILNHREKWKLRRDRC